jgi:hypothetical protein
MELCTKCPLPLRALCTVCLIVAAVYISCTICQAQASGPVRTTAAPTPALPRIFSQTRVKLALNDESLAEMLDRLIPESTALNYVVEDLPIKRKGTVLVDGTLKDALDRIADLFDYTWRVRKGTIVIFEKRFSDPNEHPQLILPELQRVARGMNTVLRAIPIQSGMSSDGENIRTFHHSLTPEQLVRLNRKEAIGIQDLTEAQRTLMLTALYSSAYRQMVAAWQDIEVQLIGMPSSYLALSQGRKYRVLTYYYPQRNAQLGRQDLRLFLPSEN